MFRAPMPASFGVYLALVLEIEQEQLLIPHEVLIDISDPEGHLGRVMAGFQAERPPRLEPGENVTVPLPVNLQPVMSRVYGEHRLDISLDVSVTCTLRFWVLHPEEQNLPPWT